MFRLLLLALGALGAGRLLSGLLESGAAAPRAVEPGPPNEMVRDPICDLYLPKAKAHPVRLGGDTLYFCSTDCREQFARRQAAG